MIIAQGGTVISAEERQRIKDAIRTGANRKRGENHPNWRGGITPKAELIRHSPEYKQWRTSVFERDNYCCVVCGARNGKGLPKVILNADHIKSFAGHPELIFDTNNGRTLCIPCHKKTDNYGGKGRLKLDPNIEIKKNGEPYKNGHT